LTATWLVYWVIRDMTGRPGLAWMTALIFGVHPIHHEVVAWISGATESLFAAFFLAAFLAYLRSRKSAKVTWMAVSCGLYALALLCKETAIVFPALVFAHGVIAEDAGESRGARESLSRWKKSIETAIFYVPLALIYLAARYKALSGFSHPNQRESVSNWILTLPSILFFYLKHWVLPIRFAEFYDLTYQTHFDLRHVVLPALLLLSIGVALWMLRKWLGPLELAYVAIWTVIPLLPALDTFVFGADELVHDRYFYVPSMGAALLIALIIDRAARTKFRVFGQPVHVVVTGLVLAIVLAFCTARATKFWSNDYSLYSRSHEISPSNPTATTNLAAELIDRNDIPAAQALLESGYPNHRGDFHFAFNLGRIEYTKKQYSLAEADMRQVISLAPLYPDAYLFLSQIELRQGHQAEAQQTLHLVVELAPDIAVYRTAYGIVLELNGDCTSAMSQFQTSLALSPGEGITEREMFRCQHPSATSNVVGTTSSH